MDSEDMQDSAPIDWHERARHSLHDNASVPVSLAFSPDGALLAVGTMPARVVLWSVVDQRIEYEWEIRAWERKQQIKVAEEMLGKPEIDDFRSILLAGVIREKQAIRALAFSLYGAFLCTGIGSGHIDFWTLRGGHITSWATEDKSVNHVAFGSKGRLLAYVTEDEVSIKRMLTEQLVKTVDVGDSLRRGRPFAFSQNGRYWAIARNGSVEIYQTLGEKVADFATSDCVEHLGYSIETQRNEGHVYAERLYGSDITALTWSQDSSVLAVGNDRGILQQWVVGEGLQFQAIGCSDDQGKVMSVASADNRFWVTVVLADNGLALWDSENYRTCYLPQIGDVTSAQVNAIDFSNEGSMIAAAFSSGEIIIWHTSGRCIAHLNVR